MEVQMQNPECAAKVPAVELTTNCFQYVRHAMTNGRYVSTISRTDGWIKRCTPGIDLEVQPIAKQFFCRKNFTRRVGKPLKLYTLMNRLTHHVPLFHADLVVHNEHRFRRPESSLVVSVCIKTTK